MAKRKQKTVGKLKKELWKIFSLYIKLKHSSDGVHVDCYSCGVPLEIGTSNCQGGHWLPKGAYGSLYFEENNVAPQCYACNIFKAGNSEGFRRHLILDLGEAETDRMWSVRKDILKRNRVWYLENIELYKNKVAELKQKHGID